MKTAALTDGKSLLCAGSRSQPTRTVPNAEAIANQFLWNRGM